jgi:hypothetical protein
MRSKRARSAGAGEPRSGVSHSGVPWSVALVVAAYARPVATSSRSLELRTAGPWILVAVAAVLGLVTLVIMVLVDVLQAAGVV